MLALACGLSWGWFVYKSWYVYKRFSDAYQDLVLVAAIGVFGLASSQAAGVVLNGEDFSILDLDPNRGALVSWGGYIGGFGAISIFRFAYGPAWISRSILLAQTLLLAMAIGRIGCFLDGDDHGILVQRIYSQNIQVELEKHNPFTGFLDGDLRHRMMMETRTTPWYAFRFGALSQVRPDYVGLPIVNTQLLMSLYSFLLFALIEWHRRADKLWNWWNYLILECGLRFGVEFLRGDIRPSIVLGSTLNVSYGQIYSVIAALALFGMAKTVPTYMREI